jgi:hypothetical protein
MGFSSSKSTTKPIYGSQIEGAANTLNGAYNANAPRIQGYSEQIGSMIPNLLDRANNGDAATNAASSYITSTLSGDPSQNPYLDQMIDQTNTSVGNKTRAMLGTRGLAGGTAIADILSRNLANNEGGMRYNDWNNAQQRRAQAAGMAPGVSGARSQSISDLLGTAQTAGMMPIQAATANAAGIGGLLGQYTQTKQSNPWGPAFGQFLSSLAKTSAGGG